MSNSTTTEGIATVRQVFSGESVDIFVQIHSPACARSEEKECDCGAPTRRMGLEEYRNWRNQFRGNVSTKVEGKTSCVPMTYKQGPSR